MINNDEFRKHAHDIVDWLADYYNEIESYPVKPDVKPGEIRNKLPDLPPGHSEDIDEIMKDFKDTVLPGMTHWQSPSYFAYFPANSSYPSLLAEMLTAGLAAQCMIWDTSPAAAELEEQMMEWLKMMTGLPESWEGVIQDGASTATLTSLLTAREVKAGFGINADGYRGQPVYRVYCSAEAHSSIEKAAKIAGFGTANVVKVGVDDDLALLPRELDAAIQKDIKDGMVPLAVVAAIGTTGTTAVDPIEEIGRICIKHNIWLHVDAAYSGTALLLEEYRWMIRGIEMADSFVFNPHKWMFTNFDCTAYFVKDPEMLIRTFEILPEYLKTFSRGRVNDYRDWGIPMGRRFRALKLWFVIRNFGVEGLKSKIRNHISMAAELEEWIKAEPDFEIMARRLFNLVCFRYRPKGMTDDDQVDRLNRDMEKKINDSGRLFLTHTRINGSYTLRMVIAQTSVEKRHVEAAWGYIKEVGRGMAG